MSVEVTREKISIAAADGRQLSARWWQGAEASERSIVFLSALAAPQEYLNFFAAYLAKAGWGVLTFDYRSVGSSRADGADSTVTLDDWVNLDLPAAVAEVRRRVDTKFLAVVGHSIGGQLFGQSPIRTEIDAALFLSVQRGIPRLYHGAGRLRIEYAYVVFPILINILGRLPISAWTLPDTCSGRAIKQWIRWGRSGVYADAKGNSVEHRFLDFKGLLTAVTIADDDDYAPAESVEALTRLFANADVRRETLRPQDFGLDSIGHFGFFHRRAPRELWERVENWLHNIQSQSTEENHADSRSFL